MIINTKFFDVVASKQALPFVWGSNDCALFVAAIYLEMTGIDLGADVRGTYETEYDGMRKIISMGGWEAILTGRGFIKLPNKNFVKRGDVVVAENALGIWMGTHAIFAGNIVRPMQSITEAYKLEE